MQAIIRPGRIKGTIQVPASKSMMQRACAGALLHKGKTIIHNPGRSDDDRAALHIIQQLGAKIVSESKEKIEIESNGINPKTDIIDCRESGLSARLFTFIAALSNRAIKIAGSGSLLKRPMDEFEDLFEEIDVKLPEFNGYIPFTIQGPLQVRDITIDGSNSSQFLTGLLFAYAFAAKEAVTIHAYNLISKPYVDLSVDVLKQFGKHIKHDDYKAFYIDPAKDEVKDTVEITIEGDWSSAASLMVGAAIGGNITIKGLNTQSTQGDKAILDILKTTGADISIEADNIHVKTNEIRPFDFDATDCPDLFPILAVLAMYCDGTSNIEGVHRLFNKESNRVESICEMLEQFDISFSVEDDILTIISEGFAERAVIDSYHDHRIVMAAAIAALQTDGEVVITNAQAVNKSYPGFFDDLILLDANCIITE